MSLSDSERAMTLGPRIYNLFPLLCGTIKEWHGELPRITAMKFDWIFLNPFHLPGFSGSLYAVKDYYRYNPVVVPKGQEGTICCASSRPPAPGTASALWWTW